MRMDDTQLPWIRYRDTGLYAVPSVHGRITFASEVLQACWRKAFDVIAVELPAGFESLGLTGRIQGMSPKVGLIIVPNGQTLSLAVPPIGDPDGPRKLRLVERGVVVPVTPADSIITAIRAPVLLGHRWRNWSPEIVFVDAGPEPDTANKEDRASAKPLSLGDDYAVACYGLGAFYERIEPLIQECRIKHDHDRERVMAGRLRQLLNTRKNILFVCGAAHLKNIFAMLDADDPVWEPESGLAQRPASNLGEPVLAPLDPVIAWIAGFMDDAPWLVWTWENHCQARRASRFDKLAEGERILEHATTPDDRLPPVSVGRIIRWRKYLNALLTTQARWTPRLEQDLVHSAETCVGRQFAEHVRALAHRYPPGEGDPATILVPMNDGTLLVGCRNQKQPDEDSYYLVDLRLRWGERRPGEPGIPLWRKCRHQNLNERERGELMKKRIVRVPAPQEQGLAKTLALHAREAAHRRLTRSSTFARPFAGDFAGGLDVRRSIRALVCGGDLQVQHRKARANHGDHTCDGMCPLVWIFDPDAKIEYRQSGYIPFDAPGSRVENIYSTFYWFRSRAGIGNTEVIRSETAYALHLLRELSAFQRQACNTLIGSLPEWRRCKVSPWLDPDLDRFEDSQLAVAAAVKYAAHHVVVVSAKPDWCPDPAVASYAAERRVKLVVLSMNEFDQAAIRRHAIDHEVPAPDVYEPPFPFSLGFVEPM